MQPQRYKKKPKRQKATQKNTLGDRMNSNGHPIITQVDKETGEILHTESSPLGIYANKVATPDSQHVAKPMRATQHKIRNAIRTKKIASARTCDCGYKPLGTHVEVHMNNQHNSAKIAGLETCGSVWQCPVCSTKIRSKRADELRQICQGFKADGGHTIMVTLTVPHYNQQRLDAILGTHKAKDGLAGAFARMRQHRQWRKIKAQISYAADVRALETTHGEKNGFHPHIHMILYYKKETDLEALKAQIYEFWVSVCQAAGLETPNPEHGVDITQGEDEYLAKWGASCEVASPAGKKAKHGNRSIAELEATLLTDQADQVEPVLKEYYGTMHGRKFLTWAGDNLRKRYLAEPDKTDEELAQDEHNDGERIFILPFIIWRQLYYSNEVGELLSMIEADRENGIFDFCRKHRINTKGIVRTYKDVPIEPGGAPDPANAFANQNHTQ